MVDIAINPNVLIIDPKTGMFTQQGYRIIQALTLAVNSATGDFVRLNAVQTITNKTIDGDSNTLRDIGTGSLKNISGIDTYVVTGTAGPASQLAMWNGDGDLVDSSILAAMVLQDSDIGLLVQAWAANLDIWAAKAVVTFANTIAANNNDITVPTSAAVKAYADAAAAAAAAAAAPNASTTARGIVELATNAETITGTDPDRAVTPAGAAAAYQPLDADLTAWSGKTAPSGAAVGTTDTQSLSNKTLQDSTTTFADEVDPTKKLAFQVSGVAAGATRTVTAQDKSGTMALLEGTATNNAAGAGQVGEELTGTLAFGSAAGLTTTVTANIITLSLTAGDWDVSGTLAFTFTASTLITGLAGGVSLVSATTPAPTSGGGISQPGPSGGAYAFTEDFSFSTGEVRVSLATTTNVYLVARGTFSASTLKAYGKIRARRAR